MDKKAGNKKGAAGTSVDRKPRSVSKDQKGKGATAKRSASKGSAMKNKKTGGKASKSQERSKSKGKQSA